MQPAFDTCQKTNTQHFPVKDMQAGVNAPPFYVFCRSTTCPYFDDEFSLTDKRVAKNDDTDEWYEVPANMSYPEWKKAFVNGGSKETLESVVKSGTLELDLQLFAKKHKTKKLPNDNPLWDSLVKGDVEHQLKDGVFEWEHGGYDYLIEIKEKYDYDILSKKKKPNIHK